MDAIVCRQKECLRLLWVRLSLRKCGRLWQTAQVLNVRVARVRCVGTVALCACMPCATIAHSRSAVLRRNGGQVGEVALRVTTKPKIDLRQRSSYTYIPIGGTQLHSLRADVPYWFTSSWHAGTSEPSLSRVRHRGHVRTETPTASSLIPEVLMSVAITRTQEVAWTWVRVSQRSGCLGNCGTAHIIVLPSI